MRSFYQANRHVRCVSSCQSSYVCIHDNMKSSLICDSFSWALETNKHWKKDYNVTTLNKRSQHTRNFSTELWPNPKSMLSVIRQMIDRSSATLRDFSPENPFETLSKKLLTFRQIADNVQSDYGCKTREVSSSEINRVSCPWRRKLLIFVRRSSVNLRRSLVSVG